MFEANWQLKKIYMSLPLLIYTNEWIEAQTIVLINKAFEIYT